MPTRAPHDSLAFSEVPIVGPQTAAHLLTTAGENPERLRSESGFAKLTGTCPLPASSGKTNRRRLNRSGLRQANSAMFTIARSNASPPTNTRLRPSSHNRRKNETRNHSLPKALHRPGGLPGNHEPSKWHPNRCRTEDATPASWAPAGRRRRPAQHHNFCRVVTFCAADLFWAVFLGDGAREVGGCVEPVERARANNSSIASLQ